MAKINNKLILRGRLVRDLTVVDAKDNSGRKFAFGRIAVEQPFEDERGDIQTRTAYFGLKAFDDGLVQVLIGGGARQGTLIEATGMARLERSEYEKEGERMVGAEIACVLDDPAHHQVTIEAQPRAAPRA